jgi:uncharacterized membrane protein YgcG
MPLFLLMLLGLLSFSARAYLSPQELNRPLHWVNVTDPQNYLTESEEDSLNQRLDSHRLQTSHQVTVVVVDEAPKGFGKELYREWKVHQGLMIFVPVKNLTVEMVTDSEGILSPEQLKKIQEDFIGPELEKGNVYEGISLGLNEAIRLLENKNSAVYDRMEKLASGVGMPIQTLVNLCLSILASGMIFLIASSQQKRVTPQIILATMIPLIIFASVYFLF